MRMRESECKTAIINCIIRIGVTEKTFKEKSKEEPCGYAEKETSAQRNL